MPEPLAPRLPKALLICIGVCAALLILFWVRAQTAVSGKSSTYDEPMHALGAWVHRHHGDFRINYEDPPLWHYWAALANGKDAIHADFNSPKWTLMASQWEQQWHWTHEVLYRTPENDGEGFVQRSRSMMIVIGVALGAVLAWWGWQIGGPAAAVGAVVLFSLDPNFLAHSALVKNDVPISLCMLLLSLAVWRAGRRVTPWNLAGIAVACAAAMTTKFTGVVLAPVCLALLLGIRALMPVEWPVFKWTFRLWWQRLLVAGGVGLVAAVVSYVGVWGAYGFRFQGIPQGDTRMNTQYILDEAKKFQVRAKYSNIPPEVFKDAKEVERLNAEFQRDLADWKPDRPLVIAQWMLDRKLFPEAWLNGLMFVQARSYIRGSYLNGQVSNTGFRAYFPLAMLYKTPLATLIACLCAIGMGLGLMIARWVSRRGISQAMRGEVRTPAGWWLAACLLIPSVIFMAMSIQSNLNIGHRHVLPVYPPVFLCIAWAFAAVWRYASVVMIAIAGLLAAGLVAGLAVESFRIAPDYITFFNWAVGGQRGGFYRLGDSNLDWGQDLPLMAQWQKQNPDAPLYFSYFGMADPAAYGIRYINLPGGYAMNPTFRTPNVNDVVVAISVTHLQCIYMPEQLKPLYQGFLKFEPTTILGGTIYVYDFRKELKLKPAVAGR